MSCGDRGGAGVYGWPVEITVREPEKGKREPRCRDICCKRAAEYPGGTPKMLGGRGDRGVGAVPAGMGGLVTAWSDSVRCPCFLQI